MTKEEFYKDIISVQKKTGQGLSGIVKVMGAESTKISRYLDEFIEEGLVKACDTGGSIGHPESNIFYMPTKGYNVWEDEGTDGVYSRHKGRYLHFVRLYVGMLDKDPKEDKEHKWLNPSMIDYLRDVKAMGEYSKWLKRNQKALEEMLGLDDFYVAANIEFSEEELKWIKSREWYTENKTISDCFSASMKAVKDDEEVISLHKELIGLYKKSGDKYQSDLEKAVNDIALTEKTITTRKKLHNWFESQDSKLKIQELI